MSETGRRTNGAGGVVVEYLVRGRSTWGTRLRADGSAEEYAGAEGWQPLVDLAPDETDAFLRRAVDLGFFDLPASIVAEGALDASEITWEIEAGGRRHRVVAREASNARHAVLVDLDAELQRIVGEALNRAADAAEEAGRGDEAVGPDTAEGGDARA